MDKAERETRVQQLAEMFEGITFDEGVDLFLDLREVVLLRRAQQAESKESEAKELLTIAERIRKGNEVIAHGNISEEILKNEAYPANSEKMRYSADEGGFRRY